MKTEESDVSQEREGGGANEHELRGQIEEGGQSHRGKKEEGEGRERGKRE